VLCGLLFLLGAVVHNPGCVSLAVDAARGALHRPGIAVPPPDRIRDMQWLFAAAGVVPLLLAWIIGRVPALERYFRRPGVEKAVLALVVVIVPIAWAELSLRAFVPPRSAATSLFVPDDELGWRLRPGAADRWGGVRVEINERGFRGPAVPYEPNPGVHRVLWLGDSVTFGYRIARWEDTFPFLADSLLFIRHNVPVETVNLSVEGYSQWQEAIVLATEGVKYVPDLVVVGFVLNDVTEMFHLPQFGGAEEGFQMRHAASSWIDRTLDRSAIVYEVRNLTREIQAKRRLGADPRLGAIKQQALEVETLMRQPDQPNVKLAWDFALADLQKIADQCSALHVPLLVVVLPWANQLDDPKGLAAPQKVLSEYARARGIDCFDLLPPLGAMAGIRQLVPLYLDEDHLSAQGHRLVAEILTPVLADRLARTPRAEGNR
jgi:lysophospholipase L1-like esterase